MKQQWRRGSPLGSARAANSNQAQSQEKASEPVLVSKMFLYSPETPRFGRDLQTSFEKRTLAASAVFAHSLTAVTDSPSSSLDRVVVADSQTLCGCQDPLLHSSSFGELVGNGRQQRRRRPLQSGWTRACLCMSKPRQRNTSPSFL